MLLSFIPYRCPLPFLRFPLLHLPAPFCLLPSPLLFILPLFQDLEPDETKWDQFLCHTCLSALASTYDQAKFASELVCFLNREDSHIDALVACGKLKSAYLTAVKMGRTDKVAMIRDVAREKNYTTELRLCEKYLALAESGQIQ